VGAQASRFVGDPTTPLDRATDARNDLGGGANKIVESAADSLPARRSLDGRSSRQRSRVTNGKSPFVEADGRGPWSRRWRDIVAEITNDLGGVDLLGEGQKQLIRRCATIAIACERAEAKAAAGEDIDLETYGTLTDRLGRALQRLGLKRVPRDVTNFGDLLRADIRHQQRAVPEQQAAVEAEQS
jgi:hypothetical protein